MQTDSDRVPDATDQDRTWTYEAGLADGLLVASWRAAGS